MDLLQQSASTETNSMEKPYKGRAIIQDNFMDVQIIVPARRNWLVIIFIGAWMCGWLMGESVVLAGLLGLFGRTSPADLFILFWLVAWTVGGFFAFRAFLWNLKGKEVITVDQNRLAINRKGLLFSKPKVYDLNEVKSIRAQDDNLGYNVFFGSRRSDFSGFNFGGTIRFDYGLKTVKFAIGIDEAEAKFIIEKLKERHLLTENNYS